LMIFLKFLKRQLEEFFQCFSGALVLFISGLGYSKNFLFYVKETF